MSLAAGGADEDRVRDGAGAVPAIPLATIARCEGLLAPFALALVPLALILKQPDLGTALTSSRRCSRCCLWPGAKMQASAGDRGADGAGGRCRCMWFCRAEPTMAPGIAGAQASAGVREAVSARARVRDVQRRSADACATRRIRQQRAMTAFGSGGITGKGCGDHSGRQARARSAQRHDLRADRRAVRLRSARRWCWGRIVVLFAAGIEIAAATREPFGRLVAVGIVSLLAGQTFLNLMVCLQADAGDGHHAAVRQLRREQSGGELHGGGVAAEHRPESAVRDGAGFV